MSLLHTIAKVLACRREVVILRRQVERLRVERDRMRDERNEFALALAAEQGKAAGAPPGWEWDHDHWVRHTAHGDLTVRRLFDRGVPFWRWYRWTGWDLPERTCGDEPTARAAMLAADVADLAMQRP